MRLQSFHTGIERCLVLISRVLNGGTPEGSDWHRRLLERMGQATSEGPVVLSAASIEALRELLRFHQLVRHLYSYALKAEPVERLRLEAVAVWCRVRENLRAFQVWLAEPLPPRKGPRHREPSSAPNFRAIRPREHACRASTHQTSRLPQLRWPQRLQRPPRLQRPQRPQRPPRTLHHPPLQRRPHPKAQPKPLPKSSAPTPAATTAR